MPEFRIRPAVRGDLPRLTEIYNYYVVNTPVTFDIEPYTVERREAWFAQFGATGRYRLIVAEENGLVMGYAGTTRFRPKAAYETTVETTVYCAQEAVGKGMGRRLYAELFAVLKGEDIHRFVGGICVAECGDRGSAPAIWIQSGGVFRENGRKFGKYWDVCWVERAA
ncbi:MAG: N-acetyltransferase family protein [Terriglobales bacterium]